MNELDFYRYILVPVTATVVVILGWIVGHFLSASREKNNKIREMRVQYLISAYRVLFRVGVDRSITRNAKECENAIADIQLLGTIEQIALAEKYTQEISEHGSADLTAIIRVLRRDLRKALNLDKANDNIHFLKIDVFDKKS